MKRIDTINARVNMFGIGKSGFHDNADLPGQDATYVSPEWFNAVQEELCNLLELRGITLNPASKRQLYDLLTTQADLEALATEIESNFIRKSQIVDNLTTNDATKVASAKQVKILQDNKLELEDLKDASTEQKGITQLVNDLTTGGTDKALTAEQGKLMLSMFANSLTLNGYVKIPNPANLSKPLILQWGCAVKAGATMNITFPIAFPNSVFQVLTQIQGTTQNYQSTTVNTPTTTGFQLYWDNASSGIYFLAIGT